MLTVVLQIHRNIMSSQCYVRCVDDSNSLKKIQIECLPSALKMSLFMNDEIVKKVKLITPNDFFIPLSLTSDSESSVISGSIVVCQATLTASKQTVVECSFRLQISGTEKFHQTESKLKVYMKDFLKERFKSNTHWNLFCANCGVGLPVEPVCIRDIREYCESELSEGWFCHGNSTKPALLPDSQVLYFDDTSFYLCPTSNIICEATRVFDKKCCNIDCRKDCCICGLSTNSSNNSHTDLSGFSNSSKSAGDRQYIDQPIQNIHNHSDFISDSVACNIDSLCILQANSSPKTCTHHSTDNSIHSENAFLNDSKVLKSVVQCQSCGDILTSEKPSIPFVRFYHDKLMFKNSSFSVDHVEYAHDIAVLSFWSLVTRGQTSLLPSKLFLQSKVRDNELCLLLWVPSAPVDQFLFKDSLGTAPAEIHVQTEPVYKILYYVGTSLSENVRSWSRDFNVDFYRVSDTMVKTLVQILDSSSIYLPETSAAGGFSCGFIRAPSQQSQIKK